MADQKAGGAAYEHIGWEVFLAKDSSDADSGGGGVSGELGPAGGILAGDGGCGGPRDYAVG